MGSWFRMRSMMVSRSKNLIPSQQLCIALPLPMYSQIQAHLYSTIEGRVPYGAPSTFIGELVRGYFTHRSLDLAPFTGSAAGAHVVSGSPEAIFELQQRLKESV